MNNIYINQKNNLYFECDENFYLTYISEKIMENIPSMKIGQNLLSYLENDKQEINNVYDKLLHGQPSFMSNFIIDGTNTSIIFLPKMANEKLTRITCFINFESYDIQNTIANSIPMQIGDKFRTPISNILNLLSALAVRFQAQEDYKALSYINGIAHSCYNMLRITVSVNDFYSLTNANKELKMKKMILNNFIEDLSRTLQVLFVNTKYKIVTNITKEPIITVFDENLLSLCIFHIIANSCIFSPSDSTITISLSKINNYANITITDEGIGIEKDRLNKIFEPLYTRQELPVAEERIGIGLGLTIAKLVVQAHNGKIFVTSEVNKGTTISINLPIVDDDDMPLTLNTETVKYMTDRFSNIYLIFSEICDISFY